MTLRASKGQGAGVSERGGSVARACKTCALAAPRARMPGARRNANACQEAWMRLGINRSRLEVARSLADTLVWLLWQAHNANS